MNPSVFTLYILNLAVIGALPAVFFKKDGRFNLMWWLTAGPFVLCAVSMTAGFTGLIQVLPAGHGVVPMLREIAAVAISVTSIALIFLTVGIHRVPLSLWHQQNDAPVHIVTCASYRWIRHPFYTAFLLALIGAFVFMPHIATFAAMIYGQVVLNTTAAREERRLKTSELGQEYEDYMQRAGRFIPRWSALVSVKDSGGQRIR